LFPTYGEQIVAGFSAKTSSKFDGPDIHCRKPASAFRHIEFYTLSLLKNVPIDVPNGAHAKKHILSLIGSDEASAYPLAEPFYLTLQHRTAPSFLQSSNIS
jgi:hypothetical protein